MKAADGVDFFLGYFTNMHA